MLLSIKKAGLRFEDYIITNLEGLPGYKLSSAEQDRKWGTDFFYYGVPIDITLNPNKNNVTFSETYIDILVCKIYVGFRTGNGKARFEHPVLVLYFNLLDMADDDVLKLVAYEFGEEALEKALDIFWCLLDQQKNNFMG